MVSNRDKSGVRIRLVQKFREAVVDVDLDSFAREVAREQAQMTEYSSHSTNRTLVLLGTAKQVEPGICIVLLGVDMEGFYPGLVDERG
jgi:hypothetical protein